MDNVLNMLRYERGQVAETLLDMQNRDYAEDIKKLQEALDNIDAAIVLVEKEIINREG